MASAAVIGPLDPSHGHDVVTELLAIGPRHSAHPSSGACGATGGCQLLVHQPPTIAWHLTAERLTPPTESTIRRVLHAEILNWLDDHSRYLLAAPPARVSGDLVVTTFTTCINTYGPQTQGKIERLHATLKRWLAEQPPATTLPELQTQLDTFREIYDTARPHRDLDRATPRTAYLARPKARPAGTTNAGHYRLRFDHVGTNDKISLRRAGRMHHLGVGAAHRGAPVLVLIDETTTTVIHRTTGEVLATCTIDPTAPTGATTNKSPADGRALPL